MVIVIFECENIYQKVKEKNMDKTIFIVLWIICSLVVWVIYHKLFDIVYFDLFNGCLREIIVSGVFGAVLAAILSAFIIKYWYVIVIVVVLLVIIAALKSKS